MPRRSALLSPASIVLTALAGTALLLSASKKAGSVRTRRERPWCRVIVIGAGFGGLHAALRLAGKPGVDLTVIDAHDHHLFQPLLYQVATAALAPTDITSPLCSTIPAGDRTRVLTGPVTGIDLKSRHVVWNGSSLPYDELIIATGSIPSYFGHEDWARAAPGLKTLEDALELRGRILRAFQRASRAAGAERQRLLTFVLIGGGPTGVEMAGAIAELARDLLKHDDAMPGAKAHIILIEAGDRVLPEFTPDLSQSAADSLDQLGVVIRSSTRVTAIDAGMVHLHDETLEAETVIWTAGNAATPVAHWLGVKAGHGGRVPVGADLTVAGYPELRVIGDASLARNAEGKPLPGLAPVAKQQGYYAARAILRRLRGRRPPAPFAYRDYGTLATIGRGRAVAEFGRIHVTGEAAWLLWAVAHIFFLIGFRNRVMVSTQWALLYVTHQRIHRRMGTSLFLRRGSQRGA